MSRRQKQKQRKQHTTPNPETLAETALERGNFKDALKQARVAARKNPSPANQQLLEFAMLQRARQLHQTSHPEQCLDLLDSLAKAATNPDVIEALPEFLMRVGVLDRYPQYSDRVSQHDRDSIRAGELDREICSASAKDRCREAELVRSALEAVERGEDDQATDILRGIGRQSLAADWRLFVRGLMAWYRRDIEAAEQNWTRLNPDRAATKIADRLRSLDQFQGGTPNAQVAQTLNRLSSSNGLVSLVERLQRLRTNDAREIRQTLSLCKQACLVRPDILERIVVAVCGNVFSGDPNDAYEIFVELAKGTIAPRLDPKWNRALAISLDEYDLDEADERAQHWAGYLDDLNAMDALSDRDRAITKSLVARQIGLDAISSAKRWKDCNCGDSHIRDIARDTVIANKQLESSVEFYPRNEMSWKALLAMKFGIEDDTDGFIDVGRRLLVHIPNDIESLRLLSQNLLFSHPFEAREFAERAARLRPLDQEVRNVLIGARFGCAREYAKGRDFDKARSELNLVGESPLDDNTKTALLVRKAIIEFVSGKATKAEKLAEEAKQVLEEPTLALLQLAVEGIRLAMSSARVKRFEAQLKTQLKRACNSQTAAALSNQMTALRDIKYRRQDEHEKLVLAYIRRTTRVKYKQQDLRSVCGFLIAIEETQLLEKQLEKGCKKFPDDPWFHLGAAEAEMEKGPFDSNRKRAKKCFTRVIEICSDQDDDDSREMLAQARIGLSTLDDSDGRSGDSASELLEMLREMPPFMLGHFADLLRGEDVRFLDLPQRLLDDLEQLPQFVREALIHSLESGDF